MAAPASFSSITSMTAYYGPIAPPLDLSLFENGAKDVLLPFLRLGKLSSSDDKEADRQEGNHKHREIDHAEHEYQDEDDEELEQDDHLSYSNSSHFHATHFDSDDGDEEDGYQSDIKMDTSSIESDNEPPLPVSHKRGAMKNGPHTSIQDSEKDIISRVQSSRAHRNDPVTQDSEESTDEDDDEEDTSVIRCACGNNVDFGLMIQCEKCEVWQHAGCVGLKSSASIPSHYYCERCKPRPFNCSCNKKEANGKMVICTQCHMFQHLQCVPVIRDPHVCSRCSAKTQSHSAASRSSNITPTVVSIPADAGRGKRGRRPKKKKMTLSRTAPIPHKHETRSHTSSLQNTPTPSPTPQNPSPTSLPQRPSKRAPAVTRAGQPKACSPPHTPPPSQNNKLEEESPPVAHAQSHADPSPPTTTPPYSLPPSSGTPSTSTFHTPTPSASPPHTSPPPSAPRTPPTPPLSDFHFVPDSEMCKLFEEDSAYLSEYNYHLPNITLATDNDNKGNNNTKTKTKKTKYKTKTKLNSTTTNKKEDSTNPGANGEVGHGDKPLPLLSFPERMLLAKYAACYCNAIPEARDTILEGIGVLLGMSNTIAKAHMWAMAQEFSDYRSCGSETKDPKSSSYIVLDENKYAPGINPIALSRKYGVSGDRYAQHSRQDDTDVDTDVDVDGDADTEIGGGKDMLEHASESMGLVLSRPVNKGTLISEYRGTVVARETLCRELLCDQLFYLCHTPNSFVLMPPCARASAAIGVDARRSGSPARFVRRSCTPNSEIRILWEKNKPRFMIFSTQSIDAHEEVTIPFDSPWRVFQTKTTCACEFKACEVEKWYHERINLGKRLQKMLASDTNHSISPGNTPYLKIEDTSPYFNPRDHNHSHSSSHYSHSNPSSPYLHDRSASPSPSITPTSTAPSSDDDSQSGPGRKRRPSGVRQLESTLNPFTPPGNRPSREQRKLQALVKTFEKLEHREKRKKDDPLPDPSQFSMTGVASVRWKRKKKDTHTPILSPESASSPSISSPDFEYTTSTSTTSTSAPNTSSTTTTASTLSALSTAATVHQQEGAETGNEWRRRYTRKRPLSPTHSHSSPSPSPALSPLPTSDSTSDSNNNNSSTINALLPKQSWSTPMQEGAVDDEKALQKKSSTKKTPS
eukprot:Phypoly_transcript_01046.p1 GENE.Phypoly_transcript_01046~~Phypoly_transcript_01046.p1  ORF type:complete len:1142 (+),score=210.11 Phypoly_transcript_01046:269-3694(+)